MSEEKKRQRRVEEEEETDSQYDDWSDVEYILFGPDRKLVALEPSLIRLYADNLVKKGNAAERVLEIAEAKNGTAVMFLMVSVPDFQVLNHLLVGGSHSTEQWQGIFRRMMEYNFTSKSSEVYDRAYELYKTGDFKGKGFIHRICMAVDELYPLMDAEGRRLQRKKVWAGIDERLHPEKRKDRPSSQKKSGAKAKKRLSEKLRKSANRKARDASVPRNAKRGHKMKKTKKKH